MEPIGWFVAGICFITVYSWLESFKKRPEEQNPTSEPKIPGRMMNIIRSRSGVVKPSKTKPKIHSDKAIYEREQRERGLGEHS